MTNSDNDQYLQRLTSILAEHDAADESLNGLFDYLAESEQWVLLLITHLRHPSGPPPVNPPGGSMEFGLVLYWLDCPPPEIQKLIDESELFKLVWEALQDVAPKTKITPAEYQTLLSKLEGAGVVGEDGTIWGTSTYEQLDHLWSLAAVNYAINLLDKRSIHALGGSPYQGPLKGTGDAGPLVAVIGDWGTGKYPNGPAGQIMAQVRALDPAPDYIIHLGDVYYAGTDLRPLPFEEKLNFLDLWGESPANTAFTLNSNHEMYGAAAGYFDVALDQGTPFCHQNKTSYFALTHGDWVILGLDSAYYSDAANGDHFYMRGAIGTDIFTQQADWIAGLGITPNQKVIVMTHHNPIAFDGEPSDPPSILHAQVKAALGGRMPDYWYWGHVHIGVAYNQTAACAPSNGRCVGHSAIPFGIPWGLDGLNTYDYSAQTPNRKLPGSLRVLNGFMTIQLNADSTLTETFYEQGNCKPVWQK